MSQAVLAQMGALDCEGPAGEAESGSPAYRARDAINIACAQQRHADAAQHPVLGLPLGPPVSEFGRPTDDAYREPTRHAGVRFQFEQVTLTSAEGETLLVEIYRPCTASSCTGLPQGLRTFEPPYPAVISIHGGASRKELHWWSSQPLAESGYMVLSFDDGAAGTTPSAEEVQTVLDWLMSTPATPTAAGEHNPYWQELRRNRIGLAGHSAGGVLASRIGQEDPRVSAIVSWDRAQSGPMPEDLVLRTPALFQFADYNCQQVPVCQPEPYPSPPPADGPGNKHEDFLRLKAAGVDSMQIAIRAATHLDWTPPVLAGSRYGELTSLYYTLAWFDRYLRGADDREIAAAAHQRLTSGAFDDSADRHNISQGIFDPVRAAQNADPYGGNVPYRISGMPVADRLSFYYRSKCDLSLPDSSARVSSDDLRSSGCTAASKEHPPVSSPQGRSPLIGGLSSLPLMLLMLFGIGRIVTFRGRAGGCVGDQGTFICPCFLSSCVAGCGPGLSALQLLG